MAALLLILAGCSGSNVGSHGYMSGSSSSGSDGSTAGRPAATGSATLSWRAPTQNEDGTALTNLAGYKVRYGVTPSALNAMINIASPATTTVTIEGLAAGTWYFTLSAYTNAGIESDQTTPAQKTIG
jgi:hypothetical protein